MEGFLNEEYKPDIEPSDEMASFELSEKFITDFGVRMLQPFYIDAKDKILTCTPFEIGYSSNSTLYRWDIRDGDILVASAGMNVEDDKYINPDKKNVALGMPVSIMLKDASSIPLGGAMFVRSGYRRKKLATKLLDYRLAKLHDLGIDFELVGVSTALTNEHMQNILINRGFVRTNKGQGPYVRFEMSRVKLQELFTK